MADLLIEHVLYRQSTADNLTAVAHSAGITEEIQQQLSKICSAFADPPSEWTDTPALLVCPVRKKNVAILQALPGQFYFLVLPLSVYREQGGDPFQLIEQLPAQWELQGELEPRGWKDAEPSPLRKVEDIQTILKGPDGPSLLGAAQALLDGAPLVLERSKPETELLHHLWQLLPVSSRTELGFATFICAPGLPLNVVVTPLIEENAYAEHWREAQIGDYPEGRYELQLQVAVESADQDGMNRLFMRRSPKETIRLGIVILILALLLPVIGGLLGNLIGDKDKATPAPSTQEKNDH